VLAKGRGAMLESFVPSGTQNASFVPALMCGKALSFRGVEFLFLRLCIEGRRRSFLDFRRGRSGKAEPYRTSGGKAARDKSIGQGLKQRDRTKQR
jgi:hypothetical protein